MQLLKLCFEWIWNKLARCPWSTQRESRLQDRTIPLGGNFQCAHRGRDAGQVKVVPAWSYKSTSRLFCSFLFIWFFQLFQELCICTIEKKNVRKTQDTWKSYSFIFGSALPARTPEAGKFFWSPACTPCQTRTFSQVQGSVLLRPQPGGTRRSVSLVVLTACVRAQ